MRGLSDPRRLVPFLIGIVAGIIMLGSLAYPNMIGDGLIEIAQITLAIGLLLGALNVLGIHVRTVARGPGRLTSLVLVIAALVTFAVELLPTLIGGVSGLALDRAASAVFRYMYQPLATSVLALLTFFALRAVWRALTLRTRDALAIIVVAAIFMIGSGPWNALVPGLQESLDWINVYPVAGVTRGLILGISIGAMVATLRVLLGFDQPYVDR